MTTDPARLVALAQRLRGLHHGEMLVLPNAWDAASAQVVADAGFPAIATSSAAIAAMLGHPDAEGAPPSEMFAANARIARSVSIPVTMDAEGGYGLSPSEVVERLLENSLVGCNLEDTDHRGRGLVEAEAQAEWLAAVRSAADSAGVPVVLNARIDVFLPTSRIAEGDRIAEAIRRGQLYRNAGADCLYPIGVGDPATLATLIAALDGPVNGNSIGELDLARLRALGVARVSYGPRFYRQALAGLATALGTL
jgi:2-methylisocitrate lyase-like PEP mutase family enzyme